MLEKELMVNMELKTFTEGIKYLKGFFPNWNFDINNLDTMEVWYMAFANLSDEEYGELVKEYCKREQYPPISPNSILKYYDFKSSEEVMKWVESINDQYPYNIEYTRGKFYQELSKDKIAYKVFKYFEKVLGDYSFFNQETREFNDNGLEVLIGYGWIRNQFKHGYDIEREKNDPLYRLSKYRDNKNKELKFENKKAIEYRR